MKFLALISLTISLNAFANCNNHVQDCSSRGERNLDCFEEVYIGNLRHGPRDGIWKIDVQFAKEGMRNGVSIYSGGAFRSTSTSQNAILKNKDKEKTIFAKFFSNTTISQATDSSKGIKLCGEGEGPTRCIEQDNGVVICPETRPR